MYYKVLNGRWKDSIVTKRELSDKEADDKHPPVSMGFVCVYSDNNYLGWCGTNWFKNNTSLLPNG